MNSSRPLWEHRERRFFCIPTKTNSKPVKKTEKEKAEEKRRADAWAQITEDTETARQLRKEYADKLTVTAKTVVGMLRAAINAAAITFYCSNSYGDRLQETLGLKTGYFPDRGQEVLDRLMDSKPCDWPKIIFCFFDGMVYDKPQGYVDGYKNAMPEHKDNPLLDACYLWLTEFGYQMSDVEKQLQDGTHPSFAR